MSIALRILGILLVVGGALTLLGIAVFFGLLCFWTSFWPTSEEIERAVNKHKKKSDAVH